MEEVGVTSRQTDHSQLLDADLEAEEELENEIYKTEHELDGYFTGSTYPTRQLSALSHAEPSLRRVYDSLLADNRHKERRLAKLSAQMAQTKAVCAESSAKRYYQTELARLKACCDDEDFQTEQLRLLMQRDSASILLLQDRIHKLAEANRRMTAPCEKSVQAELVAVNSMTLLNNDKLVLQAEAEARRKAYYKLMDRQGNIRAKTAQDIRGSIERISRTKLMSRARVDAVSKLKELLEKGLSDLDSSKALNAQLDLKIKTFYKEIGRIRAIIEGSGWTMTGNPGMTAEEVQAVVSSFKQLISQDASLKHKFAILTFEAETRRSECTAIREELSQLKASNEAIVGPTCCPIGSVNMLRHNTLDRLSLDSKEAYLKELETLVMRVLFYVLGLMERVQYGTKTVLETVRQPDDVVEVAESFKRSIIRFRRGFDRTGHTEMLRRSKSVEAPSLSREPTFKTEVELGQYVPPHPLSSASLKQFILNISPQFAEELDGVLLSLKASLMFRHFLDENRLTALLSAGVTVQEFPEASLKLSHSAFKEFLETVVRTYCEFHGYMTSKIDLVKGVVEKNLLKYVHARPRLDREPGLQQSPSMPIKMGSRTFSQIPSSHFVKEKTADEAEQELNSYDEKLTEARKEIKAKSKVLLPIKKPERLRRRTSINVPKTASSARQSAYSKNLLMEIKTYDSKLAKINSWQRKLVNSPPPMQTRGFLSPQPKFMSMAALLERRKSMSRRGSIGTPSLA
jgi:hypothetical protein